MRFVTYRDGGTRDLLGVLPALADREADRSGPGCAATPEKVHPIRDFGLDFADMGELIASYDDELAERLGNGLKKSGGGLALDSVSLQAPIPHPRHDLMCVGQNYAAHAMESSRYSGGKWTKPEWPVYFTKRVDRCVGPGGAIKAHADITSRLDYEAELAVVIGKTASRVRPEDVFRHVFGYTAANDVSARDLQLNHVQYAFGKGLDGFAPMGPWITTADEFAAPPHLAIRSRVNGELRQDSNTSDFIFDIPRLVSELSAGIALEPGDVILTGTPAGVGMGFQPPKFLKAGDVVECEIEGIGILRNTVE